MLLPEQESARTEFKEAWTEKAKTTLVAFANTFGGDIFFGVADDRTVKGLSVTERDRIIRSVMSFARNGCHPSIEGLITESVLTISGKKVLVIHVEPGALRPYSTSASDLSEKTVFVRVGASSVGASRDEIVSMASDSNPIPWEDRTSLVQDLSFSEAARIFATYGQPFGKEFMHVLRLTNKDGLFTNLGWLVSDQNTAGVNMVFFDEASHLVDVNNFSGSILQQMESIRKRLDEINAPLMTKTDRQARDDFYPYPPHALREALTNSLAHRDYSKPVATAINIFSNRMEFVSFGGLPFGMTEQDALKLGISVMRNPGLANIFFRFRWMEHYGSGFPDIWAEYKTSREQPQLVNAPKSLTIVLPKLAAVKASSSYDRVLNLFSGTREMSRSEIEELLGLERSAVGNILKKLMLQQKIVRVGVGRSTKYRRV